MAYNSGDLTLKGSHNGYGDYRYDTTDTAVTVDTSGYFNNTDDVLNLAVGDMIEVVVWGTATRSGTIADVENHVVVSVSSAGLVDISDPLNATSIGDTD
jgi:protein involved in polysaccharide export with SLBB domain